MIFPIDLGIGNNQLSDDLKTEDAQWVGLTITVRQKFENAVSNFFDDFNLR